MPLQLKTSFQTIAELHDDLLAKIAEEGGTSNDLVLIRLSVQAPSRVQIEREKEAALRRRAAELGIDISELETKE